MKKAEAYEVITHSVECPECFNTMDIDADDYITDELEKEVQEVQCDHCQEYFIALHPDYSL